MGAIAEERLGPAARALVRELIGDASLSDPEVATWADAIRDRRTGPWHYVDIPFSAPTYEPARDCPQGACAVAAIARFSAVLASDSSSSGRDQALRWIVHLVADLHQPLHAGDRWDRGGNDFRVRIGRRNQPTSLHRVWDVEVVAALVGNGGTSAAAHRLSARITPEEARAWAVNLDPASWAMESSQQARAIYAELDRRPTDRTILHLPRDYPLAQQLRASEDLERAGVRLAALLDQIARQRLGQSRAGSGNDR